MPDLHGWILQQINETERTARNTQQPSLDWEHDDFVHEIRDLGNGGTVAHVYRDGTGAHIAQHDPQSVLRRCKADRKILEVHKPYGGKGWGGHACTGCGEHTEDWAVDHANDCPVLLALAEGYGLTPEVLAGLDRPTPEPYPPVRLSGPPPDTRRVPPALRGPNWKAGA